MYKSTLPTQKFFKNSGEAFDTVEAVIARVSILEEVEQKNREQIDKLLYRIETLEEDLHSFKVSPIRAWFFYKRKLREQTKGA
jgi:hypothetical protein